MRCRYDQDVCVGALGGDNVSNPREIQYDVEFLSFLLFLFELLIIWVWAADYGRKDLVEGGCDSLSVCSFQWARYLID